MWNELIDQETGAYIANKAPALFGVLPLYGVLIFIGFGLSCGYAYIGWNNKKYRNWDFIFCVSFTSIFALYGAKLWYLIFDPINAFSGVNDVLDVIILFCIPAFGRSIIGTVIFVPIGIWIWQKYWGPDNNTLEIFDVLLPSILIGQAIGRWGNFVNHQVYGDIVDPDKLNWLPIWLKNNMFIIDDSGAEWRNPLFLYESFADLGSLLIIILIFKTNNYWKRGTMGFSYIFLYGIVRSSTELLRDSQFQMSWGANWNIHIPTSFITALILVFVSFFFIIYLQWGDKIKKFIKFI
ncbi:MAG: prolipoprotein diacylglyceryl transferase [Candidatus Tyloplasma litorale]|nr:MAG: prolipoprotein diacylglyceryl transferase [Mycoplasmatales bacterium]